MLLPVDEGDTVNVFPGDEQLQDFDEEFFIFRGANDKFEGGVG